MLDCLGAGLGTAGRGIVNRIALAALVIPREPFSG